MRQYIVFVCAIQVFVIPQPSVAAFERIAQPTALFARASSGIAMASPENLFVNPASLSFIRSVFATSYYSPSPFGLSQLSNYGAAMAHPFGGLSVAAGVSSFGFSLYRESIASAVCGMLMTDQFSSGASFHLYHLSVDRYGSAYRGIIDLGALFLVNDQVTVGMSISNLLRTSFGDTDDIPTTISGGISLKVTPNTVVNADMVKDVRYPVSFAFGIEYQPHEIISIQTGTNGETSQLFGGVGIQLRPFRINYGVAAHPELGVTHSIGITFQQ